MYLKNQDENEISNKYKKSNEYMFNRECKQKKIVLLVNNKTSNEPRTKQYGDT